jgi:hypothetical protein
MIFYEDGHATVAEKKDNHLYYGIIALALKKMLLTLFFVLPVILLKKLAFIKFLIGMKALALTNAALMGMLAKQALSPTVAYNPLSLG